MSYYFNELSKNLLCWYPLGQSWRPLAYRYSDRMGNCKALVSQSDLETATNDRMGQANRALYFPGQRLLSAVDPRMNIGTSDFSVSFWAQMTLGTIGPYYLLSHGDGIANGDLGWSFYRYQSGGYDYLYAAVGFTTAYLKAWYAFSTLGWYHCAATFDRDGNALVYVNAVPSSANSISAYSANSLGSATYGLAVAGKSSATTSKAYANISDVMIWKGRVLSATDITKLYQMYWK